MDLFAHSYNLYSQNRQRSAKIIEEIKTLKQKADSDYLYWLNRFDNSKSVKNHYKRRLDDILHSFLNITTSPSDIITREPPLKKIEIAQPHAEDQQFNVALRAAEEQHRARTREGFSAGELFAGPRDR